MIASGTVRSGVAWRLLIVVLVVVALLTGGWVLAGALRPDTEPVPAGSSLEVGPDRQAAVTVTGDGWRVRRSTTDPTQSYSLTRADVDLVISYAGPLSEPSSEQLWSGFQQVVQSTGGTLGEPSAMTTQSGESGQSGPLHLRKRVGTGYAIPAPDGTFAIEFTVLSEPHAATADVSAAEQVVQSLTLQDGGS
jgi:hypothetical protein